MRNFLHRPPFVLPCPFLPQSSRLGPFFRKMVYPQPPLTLPLTGNGVLLVNDVQKAECLTSNIHTVLGSPDPITPLVLPPPSHGHTISTAITPQEFSSALQALSVGKVMGLDNVPNEFLHCLPAAGCLEHSLLCGIMPSQSLFPNLARTRRRLPPTGPSVFFVI